MIVTIAREKKNQGAIVERNAASLRVGKPSIDLLIGVSVNMLTRIVYSRTSNFSQYIKQ